MPRVDPTAVDETVNEQSGRRSSALGIGIVGVLLLCLLAWRMDPHPVGPARTYDKYRGKAVTTAIAAQSAIATALLVARSAAKGNAFGPYSALVLSDAEGALSGVQGTFDSIQPPDARADSLREQLDGLVGDALSHVAHVRIAARRGEISHLASIAEPLARDAQELESFADAHP
jgi:hypothetical protein